MAVSRRSFVATGTRWHPPDREAHHRACLVGGHRRMIEELLSALPAEHGARAAQQPADLTPGETHLLGWRFHRREDLSIFQGTTEFQQLAIAQAISGMRIE
jgi:hypothetical protein